MKNHNFYDIVSIMDSTINTSSDTTLEDDEQIAYIRWKLFWKDRVESGNTNAKTGNFNHSNEALYNWFTQPIPICNNLNQNGNWQTIGPMQMNDMVMGIITAVWSDPNNPNIVYAGSNTGGLFKTTNALSGNPMWVCITESTRLPGLGIQSIVVDPNSNYQTIYIATGKSFFGGYGIGIIKSTDGGNTWNLTGLSYQPSSIFGSDNLYKLIMHPTNTSILYAISGNEVYQTLDAGNTWQALNFPDAYEFLKDIEFNPLNYNEILVGGKKLWKYDGNNWINLLPNLVSASPCNNIKICVNPNTNKIYVLYRKEYAPNVCCSGCSGGPGGTNTNCKYVISYSSDGGISFSDYKFINGCDLVTKYDFQFEVNQQNDNIFYLGADQNVLYKSITISSVAQMFSISNYYPSNYYNGTSTHTDIRALLLLNSSNNGLNDELLVGTDGGVLYSNSATTSGNIHKVNWQNLNGYGLNITQFYGISTFDDNGNTMILGGTQDNGVFYYSNNQWQYCTQQCIIGDAYECMLFDKNIGLTESFFSTTIWGDITVPYLNKNLTTFIGNSWNNLLYEIFGDYDCVAMPPTKDAFSPGTRPMKKIGSTLYVGFKDLYKIYPPTMSSFPCKQSIKISNFPLPTYDNYNRNTDPPIVSLDVSELDTNKIIVAFGEPTWNYPTTSTPIKLFYSENHGQTWVDIGQNLTINGTYPLWWVGISDVLFDESNPDVIYVTFNQFWKDPNNPYLGIFRVVKGQKINNQWQWSDYSNNLPPFPVNCIVYEKGSDGGLYVGTDVGVFYTNNKIYPSQGWICFNNGLPTCIVTDLEINYAQNKIYAATFGRGIWVSDLYCPSDYDININSSNFTQYNTQFNEAEHDIYITSNGSSYTLNDFTARAGNEIVISPTGNDEIVISGTGNGSHLFIHPCNHPGNSFRKSNDPSKNITDNNNIAFSSSHSLNQKIDKSLMNENISIYPNPANEHVHISINHSSSYLSKTEDDVKIKILNSMGMVLQSHTYTNKDNIVIFTEHLPNGLYFVQIQTEQGILTEKLVVRH